MTAHTHYDIVPHALSESRSAILGNILPSALNAPQNIQKRYPFHWVLCGAGTQSYPASLLEVILLLDARYLLPDYTPVVLDSQSLLVLINYSICIQEGHRHPLAISRPIAAKRHQTKCVLLCTNPHCVLCEIIHPRATNTFDRCVLPPKSGSTRAALRFCAPHVP